MVTCVSPFAVDSFGFVMRETSDNNQANIIETFISTSTTYLDQIYPTELQFNKEISFILTPPCLDLMG